MIERLNHVAIVVPDLEAAIRLYKDVLGATVTEPIDLPAHGVTVAFIDLGNTKIELLYPLGEKSPVMSYLNKNSSGGVHHLCFEVDDIKVTCDHLVQKGMRILGNGEPELGAHGKPVIFLHPKDFCGTLIEIEQT